MIKIDYRKVSFLYLIGNLFNKGIAFLSVPIFTRLLSTSDYGIVNTFSSWCGIAGLLIGAALHMGIRAAFIDYTQQIDSFMSVITTFTIVSGIFFSVAAFGIMEIAHLGIYFPIILLCMLQGTATALIDNYSMYLMMKYHYKSRTMLMILPNLLTTVFSIWAINYIYHVNKYMGKIVPTAMVTLSFGILIAIMIYKKSYALFNYEYIKYGLKISAPLILHGLGLYILSQSDRTMITWLADSSQNGIYSLMYNFGMIATVITTSLDGVWIPWFMNKLKCENIDAINQCAYQYVKLMTVSMIIVIMSGPEIVKILASKSYWDGIKIIPPIVLSNYVIFAYTLYVNIEHYYKKTQYITKNTLIAALVNIILNLIFIPQYGYVAAAYTTLVSYCIAFVFHMKYSKKLRKDLFPIRFFGYPLFQIIMFVLFFYIFIENWNLRWGALFCYLVFVIITNYNDIKHYLCIGYK